MKEKINFIIGDKLLRNLQPGISLDAVRKEEGEPKRDRKSYMPYLEYRLNPGEGEDLKVLYYYNDETKTVDRVELYFKYFPAQHKESSEYFHELKDLVIERYTSEYGVPKKEVQGTGSEKETYYTWKVIIEEQVFEVVMMEYIDEDRYDHNYTKEVLKIVFNGSN